MPRRSLAAACSRTGARVPRSPKSAKVRSPNGLRVWTVEHRARACRRRSCCCRRGVGGRSCGSPRTGGAHGRHAGRRVPAIDLRSNCTRRSARIGASSRHRGRIRRHAAHADHARAVRRSAALRLLADLVIAPAPRSATSSNASVSCELNRLRQLRDLPPALADRAFASLLYGSHPYGHLADRQRGRAAADRRSRTSRSFTAARIGPRPSRLSPSAMRRTSSCWQTRRRRSATGRNRIRIARSPRHSRERFNRRRRPGASGAGPSSRRGAVGAAARSCRRRRAARRTTTRSCC